MATLANQPCGKECNEDADFAMTFSINCFALTNEEKLSGDEKLLSITWDGNVVRKMAKESLEDFKGPQTLRIHCTPAQLNRKLKTSPIFMNLMAVCEDLGTIKFPLTDCFCDAVLCSDFNSQVLKNDFKFINNEIEHGTMEVDLKIERMDNQQSMFEAIKKSQELSSKRRRQKKKTGMQSDSDSDEENEAHCRVDFPCPQDIPEYCKKHFDMNEHSYRIINGHLMNAKNKKGFCGEICETARKFCKELQKPLPQKASSFNLEELFMKKTEKVPKIQSEVFDEVSKWNFCKKIESDRSDAKKLPSRSDVKEIVVSKKKNRTKKTKVCKR